jgi:hypothetical protein
MKLDKLTVNLEKPFWKFSNKYQPQTSLPLVSQHIMSVLPQTPKPSQPIVTTSAFSSRALYAAVHLNKQ